ncbi:MAG TPA: hypothetical protein VHF47_12710 [Acidimicrobiales bacterium]|nr:hypothetical protein [Acidimicrobiales bacterium]
MGEAREARAEAAAEKARRKAMRPWYKKKRTWVLGILGVVVVVALAGGGGGDDDRSGDAASEADSSSRNTENPPVQDVTVTVCEPGQFGPTVKVRITNHSSKRSNYLISANLENANGDKVGEANGASNNVDAGQTAESDLLASASGEFTRCVVKNVERFASS